MFSLRLKFRYFLAVIIFEFIGFVSIAQNNPYNEVSIASPTAAALGKYGDYPVSYHTGIPQISIPIYTVKEGPLSLPISLSYHAGGMKVMETSSWVGAGWSLNAGGVITRTVQGAPDERQTSSVYDQTHGYLSDSGFHTYLWIPDDFTNNPYPPTPPQTDFSYRQDWEKFAQGRKDGEPDMFSFNVGGYSGKFFFGEDGAAVLVPEQDLKIDYTYNPGYQNSISNFTLTVPDGTKYFFGRTAATGDTDAVEITNPMSMDAGFMQGFVISSWYLKKISSADDLFNINLFYTPENYSYYTLSTFPLESTNNSNEYKLIKNIVNGVRLNKITFSNNGKIDFFGGTTRADLNGTQLSFADDANTQAKALDSIRISDNVTNYKTFILNYDYFNDQSSQLPGYLIGNSFTSDRKRLKLLSVQERSPDASIILPAHNFEYFTDFVPRRLSFAQDHWGFYNGATTNSTLIPTYTLNQFTTVNGANRDASWPAMRGGALKRITYPTGGYTEFEFEPNYTWVSYNTYNWTFRFSQSAGYDGSPNWVINTQTFSGSTYKVTFTNTTNGSQALLNIYRVSDNYPMNSWVLEPGQSYTTNIQYAAGDYRIELKKLSAQSMYGTVASFDEWTTNQIQKNETVGGLRIKTITTYDGISTANNQVTNYSYETAGKSTGILYSRPAYVFKLRNDILKDVGYAYEPNCSPQGCLDCQGNTFMKSPNSIRPMESTQGNHIGYNEIKVSQTGNGYTIYRYYGSNLWDLVTDDVAYRNMITGVGCDENITNYPFAPVPHEFMRGELKYEGHFNESGQMIKEVNYYPTYQDNPVKTLCFIANPYPMGTAYLGTFYEIKTARKTQTKVIENISSPGVGVVQTVNYSFYESPFHHQVTRTKTSTSLGDTIETRIKYATDFRVSTCDNISSCVTEYESAVAAALNLYNSTKASCPDHTCRWWAWQYYIKAISDARNTYTNCRRANYTGTTNSYAICVTNAKNSGDGWLKPILDLQLRGRNPAIESSTWRAGKLLSASFNKYDYASIPSSGIYPSKVLTVNLSTPSTTFTDATTNGTSITKDSRYLDETFVKFENGNLVEITPKAGVTTAYFWGNANTLPIVKATGVSFANLKTAYNNVSGNLSTIRSQALLSGALVNTYVYNPLVGMTSEADPNGRSTYYEYDPLQRLLLVRDHDNNILKKICYTYNGQTGECGIYYNIATSGTFTRNNCPGGYVGSQVTYTVPAGTYSSTVSQTAANTLAQNDVNTNGQTYANTNGTCSPPPVNVQGYNTKTSTYQVKFTSSETGNFYTFYLNPNTTSFSVLGQIPQGTYSVQFYPAGSPVTATFNVNGFTQSGTGANFSNITVNATTNAYMY